MAQSLVKPKLSLRLVIDEEKNGVVFAEAGKDFVEVLCSLLTLPMGTVVRLLEKHQNPQSSIVGCFHNLYKSVSDMDVDNFETRAYKDLLLYPRSIKETHCRKLKLNVDDSEATKIFCCYSQWCPEYSNFNNLRCSCGNLMTRETEIEVEEEFDGVFLSWRTSFIITDDLKVSLNSIGLVLNVLNGCGYAGFDKLQERLIDIGSEEVLDLLGCLFTSNAPLTDTFLKKPCITRKHQVFTPLTQERGVAGDADPFLTLKVFVRKADSAILYAECREEFIDFLFTFLAIPLEFSYELAIDNANKGCIGNLYRSLKVLSFEGNGVATESKCILPQYYNCAAQLLEVVIQKMPEYEVSIFSSNRKLSKKIKNNRLANGERILKITPVVPKSKGTSDSAFFGFLKGKTSFIVSDDLVVTPMNSSSTFSILSKLQMNISDIEEQVINISKIEAISLLRASLITKSAFTNGLSNFLSKTNPKEETQSTLKET